MEWLLILFLQRYEGGTMITAKFASEEKCELAANKMFHAENKTNDYNKNVHYFKYACVETGYTNK
jgi:hypothetical protein